MKKKTIALISSLDTKLPENLFAKDLIESKGFAVCMIDISAKNPNSELSDYSSRQILSEDGMLWEQFDRFDRAQRIETLSAALSRVIPRYHEEGVFDGILSIGGGQNARMAACAMKHLPYGIPKMIVSPLISGKRELEQYVFDRDITLMHSVADFSGLNSLTSLVITNAVGAICGMTEATYPLESRNPAKTVGISLLGVTSRGAVQALELIEQAGWQTMAFHANGTGGRCLENLIRTDRIDAVLDMNLHELTCEVLGGYCTGANHRLSAAGEKGIPIVFAPGAVDVIDYYLTPEFTPPRFEERQKVYHNASVCHTKIFPEEAVILGEEVARRLNASHGPVTVLLPMNGFCEAGAQGGNLYNPQTDRLFCDTLKNHLREGIAVREIDANLNDREFAQACAQSILELCKQCV